MVEWSVEVQLGHFRHKKITKNIYNNEHNNEMLEPVSI